MNLSICFRVSDESAKIGMRYVNVMSPCDFGPIEKALAERDEKLLLSRVVYTDEELTEHVSNINESWTLNSLREYMMRVNNLGMPYFFYCEAMRTRNPADFDTPEVFTSFADAGNAVAERYFGVPAGGLKYIMATKLAKDIMNGEGPEGLPSDLTIFTGPDNDPVYMLDHYQEPVPSCSPGMSC